MPRTVTFPNGLQQVSSALSSNDIQIVFQMAVAQMRGLNIGKVLRTLTISNVAIVTVPSSVGLTTGMSVIGIGIPKGTTVTAVSGDGVSVTLSNPAAASTSIMVAYGADPTTWTQVRVGFVTMGQPGMNRDADTSIIEANVVDDPYNRQRNERSARNAATTTELTTEYTRAWEIKIVNYGPNSGDNARLIKSCVYLDWVHDLLKASRLYLVLDVPDPTRAPEKIAEQWWERSDLTLRYYEDIIETMTVLSVASVDITLIPDTGPSETITAAVPS